MERKHMTNADYEAVLRELARNMQLLVVENARLKQLLGLNPNQVTVTNAFLRVTGLVQPPKRH